MPDIKLLIDTNIVIGLEDAGEVKTAFADLTRKCSENSIRVFVHEASKKDIERDKNLQRRKATLSKIAKFPILKDVAIPDRTVLENTFGNLPKPNDVIDAILLCAVSSNIIDLLVSEDDGLHRRARRAGLEDRTLTVAEALAWIKQTYEPEEVVLPSVEAIKAYGLVNSDPIFNGLRADYSGFDKWLDKCKTAHRDCWIIRESGVLAGVVIRKDESHSEADTEHLGPKITKVCTFKVSDSHPGKKYGEQLLKQIVWHAQCNRYDLVYLTAFAKQAALIRLIEEYGFRRESRRANGEFVFEKPIGRGPVTVPPTITVLEADRRHYPRFVDGEDVRKFVIPIRQPYHRKLFPEVGPTAPGAPSSGVGKPGNTIRKVYLCRAMTQQMQSGDMLFFYMSKGIGYGSQSLTSVGIVESVRLSDDLDEVIRWTAKRSVFSVHDLSNLVSQRQPPLKIIDFILIGHLDPIISYKTLVEEGVLRGVPQSICKLSAVQYRKLKPLLRLGFSF